MYRAFPKGYRSLSTTNACHFLGKMHKQLTNSAPKAHVVTQLTKPIGVPHPPTSTDNSGDKRSINQKRIDFMDPEKNKARQAELEKEFAKSGLYDAYTFRTTQGKLYHSPLSFWKREKALYFPNFWASSLSNSQKHGTTDMLKGKISVVRIFTSEVGDKASKTYFQRGDKDFLAKEYSPEVQTVEINLTENFLKAMLVKMSQSRIRSMVPQERWDRYFISARDDMPFLTREELHIDNVYTGYVFLVDEDCKIRWYGCGTADDKEFDLLWKCVRGVIQESNARKAM